MREKKYFVSLLTCSPHSMSRVAGPGCRGQAGSCSAMAHDVPWSHVTCPRVSVCHTCQCVCVTRVYVCVSVCEVCVSGSSAGEQLLARVLARCAASVSPPHRPLASLVTNSVSPSCSHTHDIDTNTWRREKSSGQVSVLLLMSNLFDNTLL